RITRISTWRSEEVLKESNSGKDKDGKLPSKLLGELNNGEDQTQYVEVSNSFLKARARTAILVSNSFLKARDRALSQDFQ
ncbi:hypothetical protein HAX54_010502, partial [Datura stramonium]|nr:hypothetical protein [Datura stramonium]